MTSLTKNNYTDIDYTAENIRDYVDKAIVAFKDSKRDLKHFVEHIISEYILSYNFLDLVYDYEIFRESLRYICIPVNNKQILYIQKYIPIVSIETSLDISDKTFVHLTDLERINAMGEDCKITDEVLLSLPKLKELNLASNNKITDKAVSKLTNLEVLSLSGNSKITDVALPNLTKLKELNISNSLITDKSLSKLTSLEILIVSNNLNITDASVSNLVNLKKLNATKSINITDSSVSNLLQLKELYISENPNITTKSISKLTLTKLFPKK